MQRGKLIVIEGTDGSGKQTQSELLIDRLEKENISHKLMSFPRYESPTGDIIKRYLGKGGYRVSEGVGQFGPSDEIPAKIASTWYALDRCAVKDEIISSLESGINIIADRYVESNMAHQGGKFTNTMERFNFISWLEELEYDTFGLPRPDKTIFLYVPSEISIALKSLTGEVKDGHESNPDHIKNAEKTYLELEKRYQWGRINCPHPEVLNGEIDLDKVEKIEDVMRSMEDISDEIYSKLVFTLNQKYELEDL